MIPGGFLAALEALHGPLIPLSAEERANFASLLAALRFKDEHPARPDLFGGCRNG